MSSVKSLLEQAIPSVFPGAVVGTFSTQPNSKTWWAGTLGGEDDPTPVRENTMYDVASITKSIPTSSLALKLWEMGKLDLDEPIIHFFPHIQGEHAAKVTIRHLLHNTAYFPQRLSRLKNLSPEELHDFLVHVPVVGPPGEVFSYSNTSSILLTWIMKSITEKTLEELSQQYFFDPLGMVDSTFQLKPVDLIRTAPSEKDIWREKDLRGEVHDESAWILSSTMGAVGSAGLFSTVPDLIRFGQMLLQDGQWREQTIFQKETVDLLKTADTLPNGDLVCLGWEWRPWVWAGDDISQTSIGKTGFTGCSFILDWERKQGIVILSNATYPSRPENREALQAFRREITSLIFQSRQV